MDAYNRETARGLFTVMTMLLEDAAAMAIEGQSPRLTDKACGQLGRKLKETAAGLAVLSDAAIFLSKPRRLGR